MYNDIMLEILNCFNLAVLFITGVYLIYLYNLNKCRQRLIAIIYYFSSIIFLGQDNSGRAAAAVAAIGLSLLISFTAKTNEIKDENNSKNVINEENKHE